jgi:choline dehydrogenase-like flavoprotein
MLVPIGLLGFLGGQSLAAPTRRQATSIIYDGSQVSSQTFDYVIAGGGLAGNVLASRLAEDTSRKILVIEAGYNEEGRAAVTEASQYGATFGVSNLPCFPLPLCCTHSCLQTWLDWQYQTVPQTSANGQPTTMRSGRALGGSTIINGMAWSKPHTFQVYFRATVATDCPA